MKNKRVGSLVILALMIGLNIVLSRFVSIKAMNFKISFTFLTIVLSAYFYGYYGAIMVALFGDLLGALLFPIGPYNPLLTLTSIMCAVVYAYFFYKKDLSNKNIILACLINRFIISLFINTTIISLMYNLSFKATFITRIYSSTVMFVVEVLTLCFLRKYMKYVENRRNQLS